MAETSRADTRARIVDVAAALLRQSGPGAVTTRGVAEAAGVQAPTIYRLFGDKNGLLEAVAEHMMATHVSAKAAAVRAASAADVDPLVDLQVGWDQQVEFGLAHPAIFRLLSEPDRVRSSPAAQSGRLILEQRVSRLAATGRLRVSEQRAVDLVQAAGIGVISTLLATAPEQRDPGLADAMFTAVLAQILADAPPPPGDPALGAAVALRALAPGFEVLSAGERQLLTEWLDRAIDGHDVARNRVWNARLARGSHGLGG